MPQIKFLLAIAAAYASAVGTAYALDGLNAWFFGDAAYATFEEAGFFVAEAIATVESIPRTLAALSSEFLEIFSDGPAGFLLVLVVLLAKLGVAAVYTLCAILVLLIALFLNGALWLLL